MPDANTTMMFEGEDHFNKHASFICDKPYDEYKKFKSYFDKNFKVNGPNSFSPTMAVFSYLKNFIGMVTCREASGKDDLFKAMSQMLFFPMSIASSLFIVANDVNISQPDDPSITDALVVAFVTPENCLILTSPYLIDESNNVIWREDKAYISRVASKVEDDSPVGDLVEMFYVFSHAESTGPFHYEEVLSYFQHAGFDFQIFHPDKINDKNVISVPFRHR